MEEEIQAKKLSIVEVLENAIRKQRLNPNPQTKEKLAVEIQILRDNGNNILADAITRTMSELYRSPQCHLNTDL